MPAVTREISIVYGSVTIGGTSDDYYLHDIHAIEKDYGRGQLRFSVIVSPQSSVANLATKCSALEAEFRKPNLATTLTIDGSTFLTWSHSGNTGFLARPSIRKPGSPIDSARCRLYECAIEVQLPADASGKDGLLSYRLTVDTPPGGWRSFTLEGEYTALSGTAAVAQYEAQVGDELTAITTALTGTWEEVRGSSYARDDEDKRVQFRKVYRELGYNQAAGTLNHAAVRNHEITVTRAVVALENGPDARSPVDLILSFDADIDKDQTTDLKGFYEGTIRPYLLALARAAAPAGVWRVRDEPVYDYTRNRLGARMTCRGAQISLMFQNVTVTERWLSGLELVRVFSGNPYARVFYQGPKERTRVTRERTMTLGAVSVPRPGRASGSAGGGAIRMGSFGPGSVGQFGVSGFNPLGGSGAGPFGAGQAGGIGVSYPSESGGAGGASGGGSSGGGGSAGWHELYREESRTPLLLGDSPDTATAVIEETEIFEVYAEPAQKGGSFTPAGGGGGGGGEGGYGDLPTGSPREPRTGVKYTPGERMTSS